MTIYKELIKVDGMSCNHCKMAVETAVKKLPGVTVAEVDLTAKTLKIEYNSDKIRAEQIRQAIEDTGFDIA